MVGLFICRSALLPRICVSVNISKNQLKVFLSYLGWSGPILTFQFKSGLVGADIFFHTAALFFHRRNVANRSLFPWQMFKRSPFVSATCSDIYSQYPPFYNHGVESPSFSTCSFGKKDILLGFLPRKIFVEQTSAKCWGEGPLTL